MSGADPPVASLQRSRPRARPEARAATPPSIRVIAFDWGDTLMHDSRIYSGPMVHWPEVAAIEGVQDVLTKLAAQYRLVVATNATDSGAELVLAALARVALDKYFATVFSSAELDAEKPARAFYDTMVARLDCGPGQVAMVGDSYPNDILGARAAGLRAVWFNPQGAACPLPEPAHDAEVRAMAELPAAIARLSARRL
jgi:FMN phosphatase YigB (HAD superfamily)